MARVTIRQADGDTAYGDQNTDGSNSIRSIFDDMRRVGATARMMLVAAAANRWKVAPGDCIAKDHKVTHVPSGRAFGFGELALDAGRQKIPAKAEIVLRSLTELVHMASRCSCSMRLRTLRARQSTVPTSSSGDAHRSDCSPPWWAVK